MLNSTILGIGNGQVATYCSTHVTAKAQVMPHAAAVDTVSMDGILKTTQKMG